MPDRTDAPDDEPQPPCGAALLPEVVTWTDGQLVVAIELADLREPGLYGLKGIALTGYGMGDDLRESEQAIQPVAAP